MGPKFRAESTRTNYLQKCQSAVVSYPANIRHKTATSALISEEKEKIKTRSGLFAMEKKKKKKRSIPFSVDGVVENFRTQEFCIPMYVYMFQAVWTYQ